MKRKHDEALSFYLLKLLGLGVVFTAVTILSPTFLYAVLTSYLRYKFTGPSKKEIQNSVAYLKRKKFIAFEKRGDKFKMVLTKLGKKRLNQLQLSQIRIKKVKWDGQWRLLTFDIPESHKPARHALRRKLQELGFFHLQRSVFIVPYPCEKEIAYIAEYLKITQYVHIITTQRFSSDKLLLKKFNL